MDECYCMKDTVMIFKTRKMYCNHSQSSHLNFVIEYPYGCPYGGGKGEIPFWLPYQFYNTNTASLVI